MPPIIDIHRATVYRGETRVFADFSFSLRETEHAVILGPNSTGKSTLLTLMKACSQYLDLPRAQIQ